MNDWRIVMEPKTKENKLIDIIRMTKAACVIFIGLVLAADIFGYIICKYVVYVWAAQPRINYDTDVAVTTTIFYICTLCVYVLLFSVFRLVNNMSKDIVFDSCNTKLMGYITLMLVLIGLFCTVELFFWNGSFFLSVISWFMALIVQCVRVVFDKAISMKDELDYTV